MKIRKGQKTVKVPPFGIMEMVCVKTAQGPASYVLPAWAASKTQTLRIDNHIFYRWER